MRFRALTASILFSHYARLQHVTNYGPLTDYYYAIDFDTFNRQYRLPGRILMSVFLRTRLLRLTPVPPSRRLRTTRRTLTLNRRAGRRRRYRTAACSSRRGCTGYVGLPHDDRVECHARIEIAWLHAPSASRADTAFKSEMSSDCQSHRDVAA
jgi:hypothetical protein